MTRTDVDGPFYDDLQIGDFFDSSPAMTLTDGLAAAHQAIVENRLALTTDHDRGGSGNVLPDGCEIDAVQLDTANHDHHASSGWGEAR